MTHILQKDWSNSWLRSLYHTLSGHCLSAQSMMVRRVGLMGHEEMWLLVCVGCEGNQEFSSRVLQWLRRRLQLTVVKPLYIDARGVRFRGVFSSLNHVSAKRHGRATVEAHDFFLVWNPYRFRAKVLLDLVETALHFARVPLLPAAAWLVTRAFGQIAARWVREYCVRPEYFVIAWPWRFSQLISPFSSRARSVHLRRV